MKIFVGCASREISNEKYLAIAKEVGRAIAKRGHDLVYGGCNRSLMGAVQETVSKNPKSDIYIVTCNAYVEDLKDLPYEQAYAYPTINERKNKFIELSDILIYLPGGTGTFDEFCSALESKKSGEHDLPMILFNIDGYFNPLIAMIEKAVDEGFSPETTNDFFHVVNDMDEFMKLFEDLT